MNEEERAEKIKAEEDQKIAWGFDIQEMFATPAGQYLWGLMEVERGLIAKEMIFGKEKGKFHITTVGEFERGRGTVLGLDRFFEIYKSCTNFSKRKEKERRARQENKSKT